MLLPRPVDRCLIDPDRSQPRKTMDQTSLNELAASFRHFGILQPVIVYEEGERFSLVDGHRRLAAAAIAKLESVPALVLAKKPDSATLLLTQLTANCLRVDLKPTEKAVSFLNLKKSQSWTNTELAKAMSVSKSYVTQILSILTLPEDAQLRIDSGDIPVSTAYAISRAKDETTKQELLRKATCGDLKRDTANQRVKNSSPQRSFRTCFQMGDAEIRIAAGDEYDLTACVTLLQQVARKCRAGAKQGLNVATLERVLADKASVTKQRATTTSNTERNEA